MEGDFVYLDSGKCLRPKAAADFIEVGELREIELCRGDLIQFNVNLRDKKIYNGNIAQITDDPRKVMMLYSDGTPRELIDLPEDYATFKDIQNQFLSYEINFNEVSFISEEQIREFYSRVNKYSFPLTTHELRKADYPGQFYKLAEKIASDDFFESIKLFTVANRRRSADVEYASELLVVLIAGPQEKKESLDSFYLNGTKWSSKDFEFYNERYERILEEIKRIHAKIKLSNTRFRQKSDFYALFDAVRILVDAGGTLKDKDLTFLVKDLRFIDENISPNSQYSYLQEYALKCVSHANSKSSREWRSKFYKHFCKVLFCVQNQTPKYLYELKLKSIILSNFLIKP